MALWPASALPIVGRRDCSRSSSTTVLALSGHHRSHSAGRFQKENSPNRRTAVLVPASTGGRSGGANRAFRVCSQGAHFDGRFFRQGRQGLWAACGGTGRDPLCVPSRSYRCKQASARGQAGCSASVRSRAAHRDQGLERRVSNRPSHWLIRLQAFLSSRRPGVRARFAVRNRHCENWFSRRRACGIRCDFVAIVSRLPPGIAGNRSGERPGCPSAGNRPLMEFALDQ